MLIENSVKNGCKNLYLYPKSFKTIFKPNWNLMSIFRRGPENPSILTFSNINLIKTITNLLAISKNHWKNGWKNLFPPSYLWYELKMIFLSNVTFPSWPSKFAKPIFRQYQSHKNNDLPWSGKSVNHNFRQYQSNRNDVKFTFSLEI